MKRPNAWRYRDYVIQRLNADVPWDRFIRERLAGLDTFDEDTKRAAWEQAGPQLLRLGYTEDGTPAPLPADVRMKVPAG